MMVDTDIHSCEATLCSARCMPSRATENRHSHCLVDNCIALNPSCFSVIAGKASLFQIAFLSTYPVLSVNASSFMFIFIGGFITFLKYHTVLDPCLNTKSAINLLAQPFQGINKFDYIVEFKYYLHFFLLSQIQEAVLVSCFPRGCPLENRVNLRKMFKFFFSLFSKILRIFSLFSKFLSFLKFLIFLIFL